MTVESVDGVQERPHRRAGSRHARPSRSVHSSSSPGSTPILLYAMTDTGLPPARCGNRLGDPVRSRGRIHRAEILTDPGRRRRQLPQVGQIHRSHRHASGRPAESPPQRRPVFGPAERRFASISPGTRAFVAGGSRVAGRLPNPALFERRRDTQVAYGVVAGAVARSCVASLLLTSCAAVNVNPRASRQPCRPGIAAAQGGNG